MVFKLKGFKFWFAIFALQMILSAIVPTAVLMLVPVQQPQINLKVPGLVLDAVKPGEIKDVLNAHYRSIIQEGEVVLESDGKQIKIPYHSLELQFDLTKIVQEIEKAQYQNRFFQLIGKTNPGLSDPEPEVYINEARYQDVFSDIKDFYYKEPLDAALTLDKGVISVSPHKDGLDFDINKAQNYIKHQLQSNPSKEMILSIENTPELFVQLKPEVMSGNLSDLTQVYSITEGEVLPEKAEAFRKLIYSLGKKTILPDEPFSYKERIASFNGEMQLNEILASAVYQAILPVDEIKVTWRKQTNQPIPGIKPGLEVNLDEGCDLQFTNVSDKQLILVFDVEDTGKWTVALAGKPGLDFGMIKTEYTKISPPVIYSQDGSLPHNTEKVKEPGKEGLSVKVYRVTQEVNTELYEDVYQPVYRIIAIGADVKKEDIVRK